MARKPNTATSSGQSDEPIDDGNVGAEEKHDHRSNLMESLAGTRARAFAEGRDPDGDRDDDDLSLDIDDEDDEARDPGPDGTGDEEGGDQAAGDDAGAGEEESEAAEAADEKPQDPLVRVVVDGQEEFIPQSKLVASYQIESAARQRLNEATTLLTQAREHAQQARPAEREPEPAPPANLLDQIDWNDLAHEMQYGDTENAGKKLRTVVERLRQPQEGQGVDVQALETKVRRDVENHIEWNTALRDLGREYNDILDDPKLAALAGAQGNFYLQQELQRERQGGKRRPFYDVLAQGAEEIRSWARDHGFEVKGLAGDSAEASPDLGKDTAAVVLNGDRQDRKATMSGKQPQPRVAPRRRAPASEAPMPSEVDRARSAIEQIRKARGQTG